MISKQLLQLLDLAEQVSAECRENPDVFFPEDWDIPGMADSAKARNLAKQICLRCPIKSECLQYAIEAKEQHGVWGGLTAHERRDLRQKTRL
jgi:WhiB family redox-sensing transcriptional regulator